MPKRPNLDDEPFYDQVIAELRRGERREGLWAKALTEAVNEPDVAQSLYMRWRVAQLAGEVESAAKRDTESVTDSRGDRPSNRRSAVGVVILWALVLWFAYDGWLNPDIRAVTFNRVGAVFLAIAAVVKTIRLRQRTRHAN